MLSEVALEGVVSATRPKISLDFIVKNESLADGDYNDYIKSFCHDSVTIDRLYATLENDASILKLMNKHGLKKELTECYAAICLVERTLRRKGTLEEDTSPLPSPSSSSSSQYCVQCIQSTNNSGGNEQIGEPLLTFSAIRRNASNLVFYDVCSGKGILSFLLCFLFPDIPKIVMIDFNLNMKLDHLKAECCKCITYKQCDIYTENFSEYLLSESTHCFEKGQTVIVIGLHLCGTLSARLIQLYNKMEFVPILIISPCCAPKRSKKVKVFMTREKLNKNKWPAYGFWTMGLYVLIDKIQSVKDIVHDELILSDKNTVIVAIKRKFLMTPISHCAGT